MGRPAGHLLGGESPLLARQEEKLTERQGCRGLLRVCDVCVSDCRDCREPGAS